MTEKNEMNKQQALEKLAALEAETKALRAIIEAPEPAGSLLPSVKDVPWCYPDAAQSESLWFNDQNQRDNYMKAFETMLDLRRQPGSETPKNADQFTIRVCRNVIAADWWNSVELKLAFISPSFSTKEQAEAAIKTVGEERILHMFNTLHGVK